MKSTIAKEEHQIWNLRIARVMAAIKYHSNLKMKRLKEEWKVEYKA